jgi:hypothetical protein
VREAFWRFFNNQGPKISRIHWKFLQDSHKWEAHIREIRLYCKILTSKIFTHKFLLPNSNSQFFTLEFQLTKFQFTILYSQNFYFQNSNSQNSQNPNSQNSQFTKFHQFHPIQNFFTKSPNTKFHHIFLRFKIYSLYLTPLDHSWKRITNRFRKNADPTATYYFLWNFPTGFPPTLSCLNSTLTCVEQTRSLSPLCWVFSVRVCWGGKIFVRNRQTILCFNLFGDFLWVQLNFGGYKFNFCKI